MAWALVMCLSPYLGVLGWGVGLGGLPKALGHNMLMQFSSLGSSIMEISKTDFFDVMTNHNDQMSDVKRVFASVVFFTLFVSGYVGGGGGSQGGRGITCLTRFSGLGSSKMDIYESDLFDSLTFQNDQISYVKHVFTPLYVFFTLFGCWGGLPKGRRQYNFTENAWM